MRWLLAVLYATMLGASTLYLSARNKWELLAARALLGVAASASTPLRCISTRAWPSGAKRKQFVARLTAASTLGFVRRGADAVPHDGYSSLVRGSNEPNFVRGTRARASSPGVRRGAAAATPPHHTTVTRSRFKRNEERR